MTSSAGAGGSQSTQRSMPAASYSSIVAASGRAPKAVTGIGPRPFLVASPSGADYSFFVQRMDGACALRLYARQKGFVSYTNNITYIATETLGPCRCAE